MAESDPRVIRRLNAIIALLLVPYVVGGAVLLRDVFLPLLLVGAALFAGLFVLAVARTFGG